VRPAWARLVRGEIDLVSDVPPVAIAFLVCDDIGVLRLARANQYLIAYTSARDPFRAPGVRRAHNAAADRDGLVRDVLRGNGQPSTGPVRPQFWAYSASVAPYAHDPVLAADTLAAAGLEPGAAGQSENPAARLLFTCLVPAGFSVLEDIALKVQRDLYDVGVDMQIEVVSVDDYNVRIRDGEFQAVLVDMASGPVATRAYEMFWRPPDAAGGFNTFGYVNDEAQAVVDALRAAPDNDAAVRTATRRLQSIFLEDPPALFLAWNERSRAVRQTFEVVTAPGRDPIGEIWRWRPATR
jgi:peptide/nickel transport system substrate-binding protein